MTFKGGEQKMAVLKKWEKQRESKAAQDQAFGRPPADERSSQEQIAKVAYELYLRRGGEHGHDCADWFQAEETLRRNRPGGITLRESGGSGLRERRVVP